MSHGPEFIHLRVRSSYSLLEGALPVKQLARLAREHDQPALGLTDTNNLFGALEFSETMAGEGIQPIIGCTLAVELADGETAAGQGAAHRHAIALLASNETGYANLMQLSSAAFLDDHPEAGAYVTLERLRIEDSTRAGVANFGGSVALRDSFVRCNDIAIHGEDVGDSSFTFSDAGGNVCGCDEDTACKLASVKLDPPSVPLSP